MAQISFRLRRWRSAVLAGTLVLALLMPAVAAAAVVELAINETDQVYGPIHRFDAAANPLPALTSPGGSYNSSVDFDPITGNLYGLYAIGGFPGTVVREWTAGGGVADLYVDASETGTGPPLGEGADIAVHNGILAINEVDQVFGQIHRFDTAGNALPALDAPGGAYNSSVDFDPVTGDLYGLFAIGGFPGTVVRRWAADGSLIGDVFLDVSETGTGPPLGEGADIAVYNGILAINEVDRVFGQIHRFDAAGNALPALDAPGGAYNSSLDFDPLTGDLYGLFAIGGFPGTVVRHWAANGSFVDDLYFDASETGTGPPLGDGADIAVVARASQAVPEPATLMLLVSGLLLLGGLRRLKRGHSRAVLRQVHRLGLRN